MKRFHTAVMAVALLAGTSLAYAQQIKTQQNAADEALTRSAPEAKDQPQAAPQIRQNEASEPGKQQDGKPLTDGKLTGSTQPSEDEPAKFSAKNDRIDNLPIMAYPLLLTDAQKRTISQHMTGGLTPAPVSTSINAKPSEQVPATLDLQTLPPEMAASMPSVRDYKFLRLTDRILVVNPRESIVVGEIATN